MADAPFSGLDPATAVSPTDQTVVVQAGTTKRAAAALVRNQGFDDLSAPLGAMLPPPAAVRSWWPRTISADTTLVPQDAGKMVFATAACTVTLPGASDEGIGMGWGVEIVNKSAGSVTVAALAGETVDASATITVAAGARAAIVRTGAAAWRSA